MSTATIYLIILIQFEAEMKRDTIKNSNETDMFAETSNMFV